MHYLHKILDFPPVIRNKAFAGGNFYYGNKIDLGIEF